MKRKNVILMTIMVAIICVAAFAVIVLYKQKNEIQSQLPYLLKGETITYFDILGTESNRVDASMLNSSPMSVVFIFEQPCSHCDKNLAIWNRIANIIKKDVNVYGVIPGEPVQMFELVEKARLNFPVFVPDNLSKFKEKLRLKTNFAQTILYVDGKVEYVKFGNLEGDDFATFLRTAKAIIMIKNNKKE